MYSAKEYIENIWKEIKMNDSDVEYSYIQIFNSSDSQVKQKEPLATVFVNGKTHHNVPVVDGKITLTNIVNGHLTLSTNFIKDYDFPEKIDYSPELMKYKPSKGKRDKFARLETIQQAQRKRVR